MAMRQLENESHAFNDVAQHIRSQPDYITAINHVQNIQQVTVITSKMFSDGVCNSGRLLVWILFSIDTFQKLFIAQPCEINKSEHVETGGGARLQRSLSCSW